MRHARTTGAGKAVLQQVFAETPVPPGVPTDHQATMFPALTCGDAKWPHDVDGQAARTAADRKAYPLTAGMPANVWTGAFWKKPVEKPVAVTGKGPRSSLDHAEPPDNATVAFCRPPRGPRGLLGVH
ncbi:hypothetical protein [Streptomyces sp. AgN23]|uniref:hypothetical protein n=1 Tax=Streptomyces sp. AgN23 TaxID=1188315 RepID=UPI001B3417BE|nr:hypothetical protein [Streptomyces sp. AgN23]QTI90360.1 hypothetical protein AS97_59380 [Streptomyces sp. AgN23]